MRHSSCSLSVQNSFEIRQGCTEQPKAPKWFETGDGDGYHSPSVEERYRRQYYEAVDSAVSSIIDRFDQPGYAMYKRLETLLLKAANRNDFSTEIKEVFLCMGMASMRWSLHLNWRSLAQISTVRLPTSMTSSSFSGSFSWPSSVLNKFALLLA